MYRRGEQARGRRWRCNRVGITTDTDTKITFHTAGGAPFVAGRPPNALKTAAEQVARRST